VPPLAGFFGKFAVFAADLQAGGIASPIGLLAVLAIALSAVGLYYYLIVLKHALVVAPAPNSARIVVPVDVAFGLCTVAALLLVLGIFPSVILRVF